MANISLGDRVAPNGQVSAITALLPDAPAGPIDRIPAGDNPNATFRVTVHWPDKADTTHGKSELTWDATNS